MNAVTAMRFRTGASTHPSDLKLKCGGRIFPFEHRSEVNLHKDRDVIRGVVTAGRCPVVSQ